MQDFNAMDPRAESALRGMMTHADERFQVLSTRVSGLEDMLVALTNATRELRAAINRGGSITVEGGSIDAAGISEIKDHIGGLETHLAAAFDLLAKREVSRDAEILEKIHEETIRVSAETHQKVEALEQTVRDSAGAMAEMVDAAKTQADRLSSIQIGDISLDGLQIDTAQLVEAFEERVVRLAALIRSDSIRVAELVESHAQEQKLGLAQMLDARLGRVSELVSATTMSAVSEVARQVPEQANKVLEDKIAEIVSSVDNNFVELANTTETEMHRMGRYLSERTAELVDAAIAGRMSATMERITQAAEAIEASSAGTSGLGEAAIADLQSIVDDRITALAKMVRSDNQKMAQIVEVAAEQQAAKQATRAVKEMAASLPAQIMEVIDRRFAALAEDLHRETQSTVVAVAKAADVLSERIGEVEGRYESGVERAAEKLGDAVVNALSSRRV